MITALSTPQEIMAGLGARLRAQRLAQNLSQANLAEMAGVSLGTVQTMEKNGRCSLESVVQIAGTLGLTDELIALFQLKKQSIAQMEKADVANHRQRASVKKPR